MKKTFILAMIVILISFAYSASPENTDRTLSFNNGTYYFADGIEATDIALDGVAQVATDTAQEHGWAKGVYSSPVVTSDFASKGSLSYSFTSGSQSAMFLDNLDYAGWRGLIRFKYYIFSGQNDGEAGFRIYDYDDSSRCTINLKYKDGTNFVDDDANCGFSFSQPAVVNGWNNWTINLTDGSNAYFYVNGVHVGTTASWIGWGSIRFHLFHNPASADRYLFDEFEAQNSSQWIYLNQTYKTATFQNPTLGDNTKNNTLNNLAINVSCDNSGNALVLFKPANTTEFAPIHIVKSGQPYAYWELNDSIVTTDGTYNFKGTCDNLTGQYVVNTSTYTWTYDTTEPAITLQPNNAFTALNTTLNKYSNNLQLNITTTDNEDLYGFQALGRYPNGSIFLNYTNQSLSGLTTFNYNNLIDVTSFPSSTDYLFEISASDSHTSNEICPFDDVNCYKPKKKPSELEFDTLEGVNIRIVTQDESTAEYQKQDDRYTFEFEFADGKEKSRKLDLFSDKKLQYVGDTSGYAGHFIVIGDNGFAGNWIDFAGEGILPEDITITKITDYHYELSFSKLKAKQKFESIGGLNINIEHFKYERSSIAVANYTFAPSVPANEEDIDVYAYMVEGLGNDVNLSCNIFSNDAVIRSITQTGYTSNQNNYIDTLLENYTTAGDGIIYSCLLSSGTSNSTYFNSSTITIYPAQVRKDGTTEGSFLYNNSVLNLNFYDEITKQALVLDEIGVTWTFSDAYKSWNVSSISSSVNSMNFSTDIPDSRNYSFSFYGNIISMKLSSYATRTYSIPSVEQIAVNNFNPYNLSLYLISLNQSNTITYTIFTKAYAPIDGLLRVYRCANDGSRTLVDIATIIGGNAISNLELLNTPYSYEIYSDGITYTDYTGYSACHLESSQSVNIYVDTSPADWSDFIGLNQIDCNLTKVTNTTAEVRWGTNPEDSSTITGCLYAYRESISNQTLIHEACTSSTNFIQRTIPSNNFDYYVKGKLFQNGYSIWCDDILVFSQSKPSAEAFGTTSLIAIAMLVLGLALIFAGQGGEKALIGAGIAIVIAVILGSINISFISVLSVVSFLVIIAFVGRYSRQNE